jgi:hypothetical protein
MQMEFASFSDFWAPHACRDGPVAEYVNRLSADHLLRLKNAVEQAYLDDEHTAFGHTRRAHEWSRKPRHGDGDSAKDR